jgi:hypothetical protein
MSSNVKKTRPLAVAFDKGGSALRNDLPRIQSQRDALPEAIKISGSLHTKL